MKKIGVVYYNVGNMASLINSLSELNVNVKVIENYTDIKKFDKLILPGVGHFKNAINNLKKKNYEEELKNHISKKNKCILGICVGMQLMFDYSEEGSTNGLGWIKGNVRKFNKNIKIPHVGWNSINIKNSNLLLNQIPNASDFYFVHSYKVQDNIKSEVSCETENVENFTSVIRKDNIYGVQFHPEKSHKVGIKLLSNFLKI